MDMSLGELRELVMDREAWCAAIHGVTKSRTWLRDWTELSKLNKTKKSLVPGIVLVFSTPGIKLVFYSQEANV